MKLRHRCLFSCSLSNYVSNLFSRSTRPGDFCESLSLSLCRCRTFHDVVSEGNWLTHPAEEGTWQRRRRRGRGRTRSPVERVRTLLNPKRTASFDSISEARDSVWCEQLPLRDRNFPRLRFPRCVFVCLSSLRRYVRTYVRTYDVFLKYYACFCCSKVGEKARKEVIASSVGAALQGYQARNAETPLQIKSNYSVLLPVNKASVPLKLYTTSCDLPTRLLAESTLHIPF